MTAGGLERSAAPAARRTQKEADREVNADVSHLTNQGHDHCQVSSPLTAVFYNSLKVMPR